MPVEECKRALIAAPNSDLAVYRRCAREDEGEEDNELDDGSWDDDDNGDGDNTQETSNSPRQDCILMQMELFPMPNFGLCESLPDAPPTPNPAPPVAPVSAPVVPAHAPAPAPAPARKPVSVDADGPARAIPKHDIELHILKGIMARIPEVDPACDLAKRSSDSTSSAEIRRRCVGGGSNDGGGGEGGDGEEGDTGSDDSSEDAFSDLDSERRADLDLPNK